MKQILVDTNFFLVPFQLGVNIMAEFDRIMQEPFILMTIEPVITELERLAKNGKGDDKVSANLGLQLARNIEILPATGKGDEAIMDYATRNEDMIVATNDSKLRKRLKEKNIRTIYVAHKSKLEIE